MSAPSVSVRVRQQAALASGKLSRVTSGVNLPPSEVIMSSHPRECVMAKFRFGPARLGESVVYGAQRPGYRSESVDLACVKDWISFVRQSGIRRVCCLLSETQLASTTSICSTHTVRLLGTRTYATLQSRTTISAITERWKIRSYLFSWRRTTPELQWSCIAPEDSAGPAMSWPPSSCDIGACRSTMP